MGEIAEDLVDGACCSECGVYFEKEHGFPVLCSTCYDRAKKRGEKPVAPRATFKEL